jgi:AcrR family transcriptional regulator
VVRAPRNGADSSAFARSEQIIEAARAVIEEHGPDALTGQIAQRAGLARPNVYRHFVSKDELDEAVARSAYRELRAEIQNRLDLSDTPLGAIRAAVAVQVDWADCHPNLYRFLVSRRYQRSSRRRQTGQQDFAADVAAAGERYIPHFADNPDLAAALVVALGGLIDASILHWLSRRTETCARLIDRLTIQAWLIINHHLGEMSVHLDPGMPLSQMGQTRS